MFLSQLSCLSLLKSSPTLFQGQSHIGGQKGSFPPSPPELGPGVKLGPRQNCPGVPASLTCLAQGLPITRGREAALSPTLPSIKAARRGGLSPPGSYQDKWSRESPLSIPTRKARVAVCWAPGLGRHQSLAFKPLVQRPAPQEEQPLWKQA